MAWSTPKTNWVASDYVNVAHIAVLIADLNYLRDAIIAGGGDPDRPWYSLNNIGTDYDDILSAKNFEHIEHDVWWCAKNTKDYLGCDTNYFPTYKAYAENKAAPDYQRLNLVSTAILNIYNYVVANTETEEELLAQLDGTVDTYKYVMKRWITKKGGLIDYTPASLTALCEEWYEVTRPAWDGRTTFASMSSSTSSYGTKGGDNADMVCEPSSGSVIGQDDYAGNPFFAVTTVNWTLDSNGNPLITAIKDIHSAFEQDNPSKLVGVMQMSGATYNTTSSSGSYYVAYTSDLDGGTPLPEAVKTDGTVSQFVLHSKYVMGEYNNAPTCCSGVAPLRMVSHNTAVTIPQTFGAMYSGTCVTDWAFIVLMTIIKYGSMTADGILNGCYDYNYQSPALVSENNTKRIIIDKTRAANLVIGSTVILGTYSGSYDRGNASMCSITTGARITRILEVKVGSNTYSAVYVDVDSTFNSRANGSGATGTTYISTSVWRTGSCDYVLGNDGQAVADYKHPTMIQGIEFAVGGNEVLADTILSVTSNGITPHIARRTSYQGSAITANMDASSLSVDRLSTSGYSYIKKMAYNGDIFLPSAVGGNISTYTRDGFYDTTSSPSEASMKVFGRLKSGNGHGGVMSVSSSDALTYSDYSTITRISPNGNRGA